MAGQLKVDSINADSNLSLRIANTAVAFIDSNGLRPVSGNVSLDSTGTTGIRSPSANTLAFFEGGVEAMRIDSSGNVGIGTSSPATYGKLAIAGTLATIADNNAYALYAGRYSSGFDFATLNTSADTTGWDFQVNGTGRMRITSDGLVGIGTSSVNEKFEVSGTVVASGLNARITNTDTDASARAAIQFKTGASSNVWQTFAINGALVTGVAGVADYMRITSGGALLVGTSSNASPFDSCQMAIDTTSDGIRIRAGDGTNGTPLRFIRGTTTTTIGTISTTTTATAYNTSSDYRLKENILPMTGALAKVSALKPVTYTWKSTSEASQGFIAHELAEVVPDAVTGEKDAVDEEGNPVYQGIDTSFLVATLTAAIQELNAKVEAQATEIAELKAR
jgi:hypothetical protein